MKAFVGPSAELKMVDLAAFVATAETGSLSLAALRRGCSQSMVSRRVQDLETAIGARLFSRTGRGVQLTELGTALLPRARTLLAGAQAFLDEAMSTTGQPGGTVEVALPRWAAYGPVAALANAVCERYPKIRLVIHEYSSSDVTEKLAAGKLDVGVFHSASAEVPANAQWLFASDVVLLGQRDSPLVRRKSVPLRRLDGARLVAPGTPSPAEVLLRDVANGLDIDVRIDVEINSGAMLREVVRQSDRYLITLAHSVTADVAAGDMHAARIVDPAIALHTFCGTGPKHLLTPASLAVESCLVSILMAHHDTVTRLMADEEPAGRDASG